jgi:GTP:adenosylcobinamide-phosphate guanylyltransferase
MHDGKTTAIVMAGRRAGHVDPLAAAAGLEDKSVIPVAGRPMIGHVLAALGRTPEIGRIVVSLNDPATIDDVVEVRDLRAQGRLIVTAAQANLVDSLLVAVREASFPVFITTADNVLLTPATATEFLTGATTLGADVAVAFARRQAVLDVHPEGQRRFYRFADDSYSNCNSYWLGTPGALQVAETFRSGGQFAKHPLRIVQAFGLLNLIRFRYGIGTLDAAFRRFSRRFKLAMHPVILRDGAAAIDVDNARTLGVAEAIFSARSLARRS